VAKLGIGTTGPISRLDINGTATIRNRILLGNIDQTWISDPITGFSNGIATTDAALFVPVHKKGASDLRLYITDDGDDAFSIWGGTCGGGKCGDLNAASQVARFEGGGRIIFNGNVGIGKTADTSTKLDVAGTIRATEIKVEAQTADFVFEDNYSLRSLDEVEDFIKTNGHLPSIPSAESMERNGVNMAEMNKLLLQKIEELTLYAIERDKEVKGLKENRRRETKVREELKSEVKQLKTEGSKQKVEATNQKNEIETLKNELAEIKALLLDK
jgi:hypothetical protein